MSKKKKQKAASFWDIVIMIWNWAWAVFKTLLMNILVIIQKYPKASVILLGSWLVLRYMNHDPARIGYVAEIIVLAAIFFGGYKLITKKR